MKTESKWRLVIFAVLFLASSPAFAAKGLYLGAGIGINGITDGLASWDIQTNNIATYIAEVDLGYGFTKNIYAGLYANYSEGELRSEYGDDSVSTLSYYNLTRIGIIGKYSFGKSQTKTFYPYLAVGASLIEDDGIPGVSDPGLSGSAGMDWFFGQRKRTVISADLSYFQNKILLNHQYHNKYTFYCFFIL